MKNYKLIIQYDGKRYQGWQSQKHTDNTIQNKLETLLSKVCGEPIEIMGSGRTDSGVHALGQVANFHTKSNITIDELYQAFYDYLPQDIAVRYIEEVDEKFHARLSAKGKMYRYTVWNAPYVDVFYRNVAWNVKQPLDLQKMLKAAQLLKGTHDFKSFCSNKHMKKSTVRTVDSIKLVVTDLKHENQYELNEENVDYSNIDAGNYRIDMYFHGDGFLYNMVRILTGTLVEVGLGKIAPEDIPSILDARNRQAAGMTAPPMGLFLVNVEYH